VYELISEISKMEHLKIKGLMSIPPSTSDSEIILKNFKKMSEIYLDIKDKMLDNINMEILSIGMSSDYKEAVACGSNMVRIGSLVFGKRNYTI
jgi:uncharacterized pyridoxal phosphate-containing UPF0001 family protein